MEQNKNVTRLFPGNDPGLDWECVEIFNTDGVTWYLYQREYTPSEWQNFKLAVNGKVESKANYWFGWNGTRANRSRDWVILEANRPELYKMVLDYLKTVDVSR